MANKDQDYQLIHIESDDDEVVFHAGVRGSQDQPAGSSASGVVPPVPPSQAADTADDTGAGAPVPTQPAASTTTGDSSDATEGDEPADSRQAPKTAKERQEEKRRAERRQMAEELAATEADLHKAGKMSTAQVITIIVCIVLLIVGVVYVVQSFIS